MRCGLFELMPSEQEKRWIEAWRTAGPELERIRREELRNLSDEAGLEMLGAFAGADQQSNGMVIFQAWMSRLRILELQKQLKQSTPS